MSMGYRVAQVQRVQRVQRVMVSPCRAMSIICRSAAAAGDIQPPLNRPALWAQPMVPRGGAPMAP